MKKLLAMLTAGLVLAAAPADAQELRIGFMSTLSGGGAIVGQELKRGWDLGLEHQGWRNDGDELGGVPTKILVADDQRKPDVAINIANRWVRSDRVHIVGGIMWSNLLMAVRRAVVGNRTILMSMNAGASPLSGELCSRYFISTSWNNDQWPESMGQLMNEDNLESVYLLMPNYQAGKDNIEGFQRRYEGRVAGQSLYPLGTRDFQAEIARIRSANPAAVFVFAPGGMGIAFVKQWATSGLADRIKLYTVFTVDWLTLGPIGEDAVGTRHVNMWNVDLDNDANRRFVRDFVARHQRNPSHFAAQGYDAPGLIASAVRAVDGNLDDLLPLMRELRKANFESVRGPFEYNFNGIPIQNFYQRNVVRGDDGRVDIRTAGIIYRNYKDSYADSCPESERLQ